MGKVSEEAKGEKARKAVDRRKLLGLAAAAAAGLAVTSLTGKARADTGDPLLIGRMDNVASHGDATWLNAEVDSVGPYEMKPAFEVLNFGDYTEGDHPIIAVEGYCPNGWGISGHSDNGWGAVGHGKTGVYGRDSASNEGFGVHGESWGTGVGVFGYSREGIGVKAVSENGTALQVEGKSNFNGRIGEPLIIGEENEAEQGEVTRLTAEIDSVDKRFSPVPAAFDVINDGALLGEYGEYEIPPVAVRGWCAQGEGVSGSSATGTGVSGWSTHGTGVSGGSETGTGVLGNGNTIGVQGYSPDGIGVDGVCPEDSKNGVGVAARSGFVGVGALGGKVGVSGISFGTGVLGAGIRDFAELANIWPPPDMDTPLGIHGYSADGVGVRAESGGMALEVRGRSSFSTVGSGVIPRFKRSHVVEVEPGLVTEESHISVTLTSNPNIFGVDAAVSYVKRDAANNRFIINLTKRVGRDTAFTYFIVEP